MTSFPTKILSGMIRNNWGMMHHVQEVQMICKLHQWFKSDVENWISHIETTESTFWRMFGKILLRWQSTLCGNYTSKTIKVFHDTVNYISTLTFSGSYGEAFNERIFDRLVGLMVCLSQNILNLCKKEIFVIGLKYLY